jgi:prepilin-type N-terminal cleavage/methylation domain-containing protein
MTKRAGFTLVELLVALALASLVIVVVGTMTFTLQRSTISSRLLNQQQDAMARTMHQLVAQLREAEEIALVDPITINPTTVSVTLPPLTLGAAKRTFSFGYQTSGQYVWLKDDGQAACSYIEELKLTYNAVSNLLTIHLQSKSTILGIQRGLPVIMETSVILRNAGPTGGG